MQSFSLYLSLSCSTTIYREHKYVLSEYFEESNKHFLDYKLQIDLLRSQSLSPSLLWNYIEANLHSTSAA